jgi:hypothetical protein
MKTAKCSKIFHAAAFFCFFPVFSAYRTHHQSEKGERSVRLFGRLKALIYARQAVNSQRPNTATVIRYFE